MTTSRWDLVQDLFARIVDLPATERTSALDVACGGDRALRTEVERLLAADARGDDAFSRIESLLTDNRDPMIGATLGPYRLTAHIASGGMGAVYRGERCDGLFEQEVAIKLIRAELVDDALRTRFAAERQALAALQHPGIARIYDGGTAPGGSPYFAMEFVRGDPIDRFCGRRRLPIAARLRLFLHVCAAVQFAHQHLIVHCDLKPANILVDELGQPRLLDFGVARLLADGLDSEHERGTDEPRQLHPATPQYASPEQLAGQPAATADDVYSLAVVLAELLTGQPCFAGERTDDTDWAAVARARSPLPPSARLAAAPAGAGRETIATGFATAPARLRAQLRGDLDAIVARALHTDAACRYASVHELAQDLERHLAGLPVRAHADTLRYRTAKFVARNRMAVAAITLVIGALASGLFVSTRAEQRAHAEAVHAAIESLSFSHVADFLMDAFLPTEPSRDAAAQAQARQRILEHAARVERQFAATPHVRANLLEALGQVCMRLDLDADAEQLIDRAMAVRAATFGEDSLEYALSLRSRGQLQYARGQFAAAARSLQTALQLHRDKGNDEHANVGAIANDLAACLRNLGDLREAERLHREALAQRRLDGDATLPVAESLNNLALVHLDLGEVDLAVGELRQAHSLRSEVLGHSHALTAQTCANLAFAIWHQGDRGAAFELAAQAETAYRQLGSDGARELGQLLSSVAAMHDAAGDGDRAVACLREAVVLQRQALGTDHPAVATTTGRLAAQLHRGGADAEARRLWLEAIELSRGIARDAALAAAEFGYAVFLSDLGESAAALTQLDDALAIHRAAAEPDQAAIGRAAFVRARCLLHTGELDNARAAATAAIEALAATPATTAELAMAQKLAAEIDRRSPPPK